MARLRVVPHFSSEIVELLNASERENHPTREKATRGGVIITRARVSHALLSLRKNGGLLVVYEMADC